jgi:hypothetical protein
MGWDNFNESKDLTLQIEGYRKLFVYYLESMHADRIYRSRENLRYCEERGIRLTGSEAGPSTQRNRKRREAADAPR